MKKNYILLLLIATGFSIFGQAPVTFTVEVPEGTTTVRMRGEFWGPWDPNGGPVATSNGLDNTWSVTLWADNGTRVAFEYDWVVDGVIETVPTGCSGRVQGLNINDYGGGVNRKYDPTQTIVNEIANSCYLAVNAIELKGIIVFESFGTQGKALHLYTNFDIPDLSDYGLGTANNGGGTDGLEYTFPSQAVAAGSHILVPRNTTWMTSYFVNLDVFDIVIEAGVANQNGDDAIELYGDVQTSPIVIETFGDIDCQPSEDGTTVTCPSFQFHGDSWAYKELGVWTYGAIDCTTGIGNQNVNTANTQTSSCPYPFADSSLSNSEFSKSELSIFPNPTKGFVNIKTPLSGVKNIQLYDIMGRQVLSTKLNSAVLDVSSVNSGLYLLRISIDDRSSTTKLIIE